MDSRRYAHLGVGVVVVLFVVALVLAVKTYLLASLALVGYR